MGRGPFDKLRADFSNFTTPVNQPVDKWLREPVHALGGHFTKGQLFGAGAMALSVACDAGIFAFAQQKDQQQGEQQEKTDAENTAKASVFNLTKNPYFQREAKRFFGEKAASMSINTLMLKTDQGYQFEQYYPIIDRQKDTTQALQILPINVDGEKNAFALINRNNGAVIFGRFFKFGNDLIATDEPQGISQDGGLLGNVIFQLKDAFFNGDASKLNNLAHLQLRAKDGKYYDLSSEDNLADSRPREVNVSINQIAEGRTDITSKAADGIMTSPGKLVAHLVNLNQLSDISPASLVTPTPAQTRQFTPTATRTATTEATKTLTAEQQFKNFLTTPDAQKAVSQYAIAFGLNAEAVRGELTFQEKTGVNGNKFAVAVTKDGTPLMIWDKDQKSGEWGWRETTLKALAEKKDILIGMTATYFKSVDPRVLEVVEKQSNLLITENDLKWNNIEPQQGQINQKRSDHFKNETLVIAKRNKMQIIGHSLIFWENYPDWLVNGGLTKEQLQQAVKNHIKLVMEKFSEIQIWDVVNEFHPNGPNEDFLRSRLGDYTELAFQSAREVNPNAILILNDNVNNTETDFNFSNDLKIVKNLKSKIVNGRPLIDGIGMHMHLDGSQEINVNKLIKAMQTYGVPVYITELDVDMTNVNLPEDQRLAKQAEIYGKVMRASLDSGVCKLFGTWNTGDKFSWLEDKESSGFKSIKADPTMFFDDLSPKPSFFAVMAELVK